jgi:hypothetical protein
VVKITVFDGLFVECLPVRVEESIIEVDLGGSDKVISEDVIIVPAFDDEHGRAWELTCEAEELVEGGISLVQKVVITFVVFFVSTSYDTVRIRE